MTTNYELQKKQVNKEGKEAEGTHFFDWAYSSVWNIRLGLVLAYINRVKT